MFKQWFANLCNPSVPLESDDRTKNIQSSMPSWGMDETLALRIENKRLEHRIKYLRESIGIIAKQKKQVNEYEFDEQIRALCSAQEAMAHQNMLASKNQAVTDILWKNLMEELARTKFMVFGDVTVDPDEALKQYQQYLPPEGDEVAK